MSNEIEMSEISQKNAVVGTEIFDPSLPSDIDFQEPKLPNHHKTTSQQQNKLPQMGKNIIIGDELKSFSVKGKLISHSEPRFHQGVAIIAPLHTHPVKMQDDEASGLKKLWSAIVGHSKREMLVQNGFIYFFQSQKQGLFLRFKVSLANLFKLFIDPEEQSLRLVIKEGEHLISKDVFPENFIVVTEMINHQLVKIGLSLVE